MNKKPVKRLSLLIALVFALTAIVTPAFADIDNYAVVYVEGQGYSYDYIFQNGPDGVEFNDFMDKVQDAYSIDGEVLVDMSPGGGIKWDFVRGNPETPADIPTSYTIIDYNEDTGLVEVDQTGTPVEQKEGLEVVSVNAIEKTVAVGDEYALPATVFVTVDGEEEAVEMEVEWDGDVDTTEAGEFVFEGTLVLPKGYVNPNEVVVGATIIVEEAGEVLEVVEVSAIDKTIELNVAVFEAEEDAKANVEIFKLNKDGEKTTPSTLKLTNLEIKEDKVVVDASNVTLGDADYAIVVKIGDVEEEVVETIEFDAVEKLVANINKATAAQLATLLNNEDYFTGFDIAKVDAYYTAKGAVATYKTIAEVQEKVIDAADEVTAFDAFVEEINETKGVFAKYTLLKETFKFVDDANMDAYMDDNGPIFTDNAGKLEIDGAMNSFEDIQDEIDQINLDAVVDPTANGIAFASIAGSKPSELNAYKADLEALQLVNVDTQDSNDTKTKAQIIKAIDDELEAIDTAREKADTEIVKAQAALDAYVLANGKVPTEGDEPAYDNVVNEIEKLQKDDLKASELATATLEGYVTTLEGKTLDLTIFQDAKDAMSDFEAAWKAAYDEDYSTGNASYDAVKASVTTLEGDPTDSTALAALKADVNTSGSVKHLVAETEKVVIYKDALSTKDVAEMRALLFDLDVSDAYLELSSATKTEFAQYVIDELAEETTAPTDFDDLQDVVFGDQSATFGYLGDYEKLIKDVNIASSISAMIDALEAISEDYEDLDLETQADIASIVYEHENKGSFKTIADIVAAMGL